MAKKFMVLVCVAVGLSLGACATYSTVNGIATPLGVYSSASINQKSTVIAEYTIILGLLTSNYETFLEKVKGQDIDIIDTNYFNFYRIVKAVKKQ